MNFSNNESTSKEESATLNKVGGLKKLGKWAIKAYMHNSMKSIKTVAHLLGSGSLANRL
jgi:hypothetical protein